MTEPKEFSYPGIVERCYEFYQMCKVCPETVHSWRAELESRTHLRKANTVGQETNRPAVVIYCPSTDGGRVSWRAELKLRIHLWRAD